MRLFGNRRARSRQQAAGWVAKLNGPSDAADRAAFEQWYCASAENAAAYDRLAGLFTLASRIPARALEGPSRHPGSSRGQARLAPARWIPAMAATVALAVLALALLVPSPPAPVRDVDRQVSLLVAGPDARRLTLSDGSEVQLAPGSELEVTIDAGSRVLTLGRGEARFTVAREPRPFIVEAAGTRVVALGTEFIVRLGPTETLVSLVEGHIDVAYPTASAGADRRVARLSGRQRLLVPKLSPPAVSAIAAGAPRPVMIEFDETRLGDAVAQMSRLGEEPVRIADPALRERRVSGAFRVGDSEAFANGVAAAFALAVKRGDDGALWLSDPEGQSTR